MPTTCQCPQCGKSLTTPDELLGRQVQCAGCNNFFVAESGNQTAISAGLAPSRPAPESISTYEPAPASTPESYFPNWKDPGTQRRPIETLPGSGKAKAAIVLLALSVILHFVGIVLNVIGLQIANRAPAWQVQLPAQVEQFSIVEAVIDSFALFLNIATVIVYFVWIYQAYRNLQILGVRGLRSSPAWAIGWYFIPFFHVYKPCVVMAEIWKASNPNFLPQDGRAWQKRFASPLIYLWWICWLIANFVATVSVGVSVSPQVTLQDWRRGEQAALVSNALAIVAGICLCFLIHWIRQRQSSKFERIQAEGDAES